MKKLTSNQIRKIWLDFFVSKKHSIEPGASLIPYNDPTLLWINSGVAALKKYFDGRETPTNQRIVNVQKSIRTNDIDNVGLTSRHHTFFEMLGNFSIGEYFKKEAVEWAMELLTLPKWFGFDLKDLYFTIHPSDQETKRLWMDLGVEEYKIIELAGNFWQIGEGPCGPNTEIFFDRGVKYDPENIGLDLLKNDIDNERYVEIWNIVFSQYNAIDGLKRENYPELPQKNIDTGAGLERIAAIFQNVDSNFETDLFKPIIDTTLSLAKIGYSKKVETAYHVIADHIRTCTFALADGAMFSNEGRGYVLRRLLRRAMRYGKKIGINQAFLHKLVKPTIEVMNEFYPYLNEKQKQIEKLILLEEEKFLKTLSNGEELLLNHIDTKPKQIEKDIAFKLYDTYGFPFELVVEIAKEHGLEVDEKGFKVEMEKQKERARSARDNYSSLQKQSKDLLSFFEETKFLYDPTPIKAKIIAMFKEGVRVDTLDESGEIVFDTTTFYAESGGQVSDSGYFIFDNLEIEVVDVVKAPNHQHLHSVSNLNVKLNVGDIVELHVDLDKRRRITRHHSSAHLLQKAILEVVGPHIEQAGSYVDDKRVRFDFTHYEKVSEKQLELIEKRVNELIDASLPTDISYLEIDAAKKRGAIALFNEKYGDIVRVVSFGDASIELCGGCHVNNTSDIGVFIIEFEESISSGVRRIQASVGLSAYEFMKSKEQLLKDIATNLNAHSIYEAKDRLGALNALVNDQKISISVLRETVAKAYAEKIIAKASSQGLFTIEEFTNLDQEVVLKIVDLVKERIPSYFLFLINRLNDKLTLVSATSKDLVEKGINSGQVVKESAELAKGGGGGRKDFAVAGGRDLNKIPEIKDKINQLMLKLKKED